LKATTIRFLSLLADLTDVKIQKEIKQQCKLGFTSL